MQRISQFFKKLFASTPKGDLIPQPTKREMVLTKKAANPHPRYFREQRKHERAYARAMKRKEENGGLPTVGFGTFSRMKPIKKKTRLV